MRRLLLSIPILFLALRAPADPTTQPSPATVDLLKLVDPTTDWLFNGWKIKNGTLISDPLVDAHVEFPYVPPEEYDYRIVFVRSSGTGPIICLLRGGNKQFVWRVGGAATANAGFGVVDKKGFDKNSTTQKGNWPITGQTQELLIQVRAGDVTASLDGQSVCTLKTDYKNVSLAAGYKQRSKDTIGFMAYKDDLTVESAEITELSGPGHLAK